MRLRLLRDKFQLVEVFVGYTAAMIIATWNIERLKHKRRLEEIISCCMSVHADILVLTETDTRINLPYSRSFHTSPLTECGNDYYLSTERRVSIYTRYACVHQHQTYDDKTALCVELNTEIGDLLVYGTIIGIHGNRRPSFKRVLDCQLEDYRRLSSLGNGFCICGDYNCSFSDNYYYTKESRRILLETFSDCGIKLLTEGQSECIDHIAVSSYLTEGSNIGVVEWNLDKSLSDHKGIAVSFS